jgi:D-arabinose 1-dehydrogenase-like Zn-dependent alcohol dehydrogenase
VPGTFQRMCCGGLRFPLSIDGQTKLVAEYIVSPVKYTTIIPEGLKPELVAPLLCGEFQTTDIEKRRLLIRYI